MVGLPGTLGASSEDANCSPGGSSPGRPECGICYRSEHPLRQHHPVAEGGPACSLLICAECAHASGELAVAQHAASLASLRRQRASAGRRGARDLDDRIRQLVQSRAGLSYRCPSCRYWFDNPFSLHARVYPAPLVTTAAPPTLDQGRRLFSEVCCAVLACCATPAEMTQQEWLLLANRLAQRIPLSLREEFVSVARAAHDLFRCDEHLAAYLSLRRWEAGIARDADGLLQASELQQGEIMARLARLVTFGSDRPNPWPAVDALAASVLRLRH